MRTQTLGIAGGSDGFISFECTPDLADDTEATIAQATDLWQRLGQPNVMIKVPGTAAGLPAIEELTRRGVNVNVTLLFSVERYGQVIDAYLRGLSARADAGEPVDTITSVASFFLSRIDTKADALLGPGSPARGQVAAPTSSSETGGAYGETSMSGRWPARARPSRWLRWPIAATRLARWSASLRLKAERRNDHGTQSQPAAAPGGWRLHLAGHPLP